MGKFLLFLIIVGIIAFILWDVGILKKEATCEHCGNTVKGTMQHRFYAKGGKFMLCDDCHNEINKIIQNEITNKWNYQNYLTYLSWKEANKDLFSQFNPTFEYGHLGKIRIDAERSLFGVKGVYDEEFIFKFSDVDVFDINFQPRTVKEGIVNSKVKGEEYIKFTSPILGTVKVEACLDKFASYKLKDVGIIRTKYTYEIDSNFQEAIQRFSLCWYLARSASNNQSINQTSNFEEIQKALALFMFDSIEDVTVENLKQQRNTLIKAFHPDTNDTDTAYAQKINAAYDLLSDFVGKK